MAGHCRAQPDRVQWREQSAFGVHARSMNRTIWHGKSIAICRRCERQTPRGSWSSVNHGDDVWWLDIPLKKVRVPAAEDSLHILLYDFRTRKIHHLLVPTLFLRENSNNMKLFVRKAKDTIHLHLSANRADHKFFQDVKVHKGGLHFARFEQHPALETS